MNQITKKKIKQINNKKHYQYDCKFAKHIYINFLTIFENVDAMFCISLMFIIW